jgi:hypothetical protein
MDELPSCDIEPVDLPTSRRSNVWTLLDRFVNSAARSVSHSTTDEAPHLTIHDLDQQQIINPVGSSRQQFPALVYGSLERPVLS